MASVLTCLPYEASFFCIGRSGISSPPVVYAELRRVVSIVEEEMQEMQNCLKVEGGRWRDRQGPMIDVNRVCVEKKAASQG
jgi:hypothetical protein